MHEHSNAVKVSAVCKTNPRTVRRFWQNRVKLMELQGGSTPGSSKRPLEAQFPQVESEIDEFTRYVRSQHLPVSSSQVKACAIRAAKERRLD